MKAFEAYDDAFTIQFPNGCLISVSWEQERIATGANPQWKSPVFQAMQDGWYSTSRRSNGIHLNMATLRSCETCQHWK